MTEKKNNIYTIVAWDVDTQRDFMEDGKNSKAYVGKLALPEAMSIAANLKSLTEYLREKDIPLFASVDWHKEDAFEFAKTGEHPNFMTTFPPHCLQESYGAENIDATRKRNPLYINWETEESLESIEANIRAHKGEIVFRKDRFDVFDKAGNPYAAELVKNLGIEKALVYGVATDVCVDFAVKGLLESNIEVLAITNCMYGIDAKNSADKMREWEQKGAKLLRLDEVLKMEYETTHEEVALYVGRFQPLTFGQLNAIEQIQRENISKLIIGIGSCEEEYSLKNPLSFEERKTLFERVLSKKNLEYEIFGIPDLGDNKAWAQYILRELPHFDSLYSGNARTLACFENTNIKRKNLTIEVPIKASIVRQRIKQGLDISEYVPEEVQSYIKEIDLQARLKLLSSQELQTPYLAVDGIVEVKNEEGKEGVLLIERKNKPLGWAFPGGFVDIGETVEDALLREIFEETSLQGSKESLLGIYSDPNRDPRQHVVSAVYTLQGSGTWKEGSDAKGIRFVPLENLLREELVFDHKIIAQDYMKQRGERR